MTRRLTMPRPSVARKIVLLSLTVGALFAFVAAIGLVQSNQLARQLDEQYRTDVVALGHMTAMSQAVAEQHSAVLAHILSEPGFYRDQYTQVIAETDNTINSELAALKELPLTPSQRNQLQSLEALLPAWQTYRDDGLEASAAGDRTLATSLILVRSQAIAEAIQNRVNDIVTNLDQAVAQGTQDAQANSQRTTRLMLVLLVAATILAVTLSILVARSMARPLREAVAVLHGVGVGDLGQRLTPHTRDEVGEMALSLNKTLDVLEDSFATMQYRATHDSLTGLANRASFHAQAEELLDENAAAGAAVLLIDLDGFKSVNDFFGHAVGDALLVEIARRLREHIRPADLAARLGGDEFAVLLVQLDNPEEAQEVEGRLQRAIQTPVTVNGIRLLPAASIGIAHWHSRETVDRLLHEADIEMYAAKSASRRHFGTLTGPAPRARQN